MPILAHELPAQATLVAFPGTGAAPNWGGTLGENLSLAHAQVCLTHGFDIHKSFPLRPMGMPMGTLEKFPFKILALL